MRRSMYSSPGNHGSCSGGMVLRYGVLIVAGKATCSWWARSMSLSIRNWPLVLPRASTTASKESSHSDVSSGSMSGSCREKPSKITDPCSRRSGGIAARSLPVTPRPERTIAYTDGACLGNPGPGGWAWAIPRGRWANGAEAKSTNQRMEIAAALEAVRAIDGPLEIVSDSTYVVNCFRDRWWEGWIARGWTNKAKKPVANRDLWEPLVTEVQRRGDVVFKWVKGHSDDPMNDLVDRLAVEAATTQKGRSGDAPPTLAELGPPDRPGAPPEPMVPSGHKMAVVGHRPPELGGYQANPIADSVRAKLAEIIGAK